MPHPLALAANPRPRGARRARRSAATRAAGPAGAPPGRSTGSPPVAGPPFGSAPRADVGRRLPREPSHLCSEVAEPRLAHQLPDLVDLVRREARGRHAPPSRAPHAEAEDQSPAIPNDSTDLPQIIRRRRPELEAMRAREQCDRLGRLRVDRLAVSALSRPDDARCPTPGIMPDPVGPGGSSQTTPRASDLHPLPPSPAPAGSIIDGLPRRPPPTNPARSGARARGPPCSRGRVGWYRGGPGTERR